MDINEVTQRVIGAAIDVQRSLGIGLLESSYAAALGQELTLRRMRYEREKPIEALYKGQSIGLGFRADFVVEGKVIVELKAAEIVVPAHRAQLLSYLRHSGCRIGLLINFHQTPLIKGIHRLVNHL